MQHRTTTVLLTRRHGGVRRLAFRPRRTLAGLLISLGILCGTLLYGGFRMGVRSEQDNRLAEVTGLRQQTRQQQEQLRTTRELARDNLDALTLRLGRMQAEMLRLDALGTRLVRETGLDDGEFDFSLPPPAGGPLAEDTGLENTVPDFLAMLDSLDGSITDRTRQLDLLDQVLMQRDLHTRVYPSGTAVENGLVSSGYGRRIDPFSGKPEQHKGIDIAGRSGSSVLAVADGIVIRSGPYAGYGNLVEIDHGNGYITRYGHNRSLLAKTGDTVHKGQPVALLGSTGRSTGPHVHIEVLHDGTQVDPARFLDAE